MATRYTDEFRRDAVRIATTSGLTRPQVSSDLGVGLSTLNKWVQKHQHDDLMSGRSETPSHDRRFSRRNRQSCFGINKSKIKNRLPREIVRSFRSVDADRVPKIDPDKLQKKSRFALQFETKQHDA